MIELYKGSQW